MNETIVHYRGRYLNLVERAGWEYSTRCGASLTPLQRMDLRLELGRALAQRGDSSVMPWTTCTGPWRVLKE